MNPTAEKAELNVRRYFGKVNIVFDGFKGSETVGWYRIYIPGEYDYLGYGRSQEEAWINVSNDLGRWQEERKGES